MSGDDDLREPKADFLARLSAIETIVAAIIALIVLAGLMLVGKGFYMKAKSEASHVPDRSFAIQSGHRAAEFHGDERSCDARRPFSPCSDKALLI